MHHVLFNIPMQCRVDLTHVIHQVLVSLTASTRKLRYQHMKADGAAFLLFSTAYYMMGIAYGLGGYLRTLYQRKGTLLYHECFIVIVILQVYVFITVSDTSQSYRSW